MTKTTMTPMQKTLTENFLKNLNAILDKDGISEEEEFKVLELIDDLRFSGRCYTNAEYQFFMTLVIKTTRRYGR